MTSAYARTITRSIRGSLGRFLAIVGIAALGWTLFLVVGNRDLSDSDEDAARVQQLVAVCETVVVESGHDIHYERPKTFADAVDRAASVASAK